MAALVCDLCGGKLIMGAGGVATCDSCGMEYSPERMKEKVQEIKGVVRVDNTHMVDNYLEMARNALDANNNAEAENYANKIIEIQPRAAEAWLIKGKAAGWQTTGRNNRYPESIIAWINAYEFASEDEKTRFIKDIRDEAMNISHAILKMECNSFEGFQSADNANDITNAVSLIEKQLGTLKEKTSIDVYTDSFKTILARAINTAAVNGSNDADKDFGPNRSDKSKYKWDRYTDAQDRCLTLLDKAYDLSSDDDLCNTISKNYIAIAVAVRDSCSYKYQSGGHYAQEYSFTTEVKKSRTNTINEWEKKRDKHDPQARKTNCKKAQELYTSSQGAEEKKRAIAQYWESHQDEKARLESESRELDAKNAQLRNELEHNADKAAMIQLESEISNVRNQMKSLGLFKGKEKKALAAKIDELNAQKYQHEVRWNEEKNRVENEQKKISVRTDEIAAEFTKDRGRAKVVPSRFMTLFSDNHAVVTGSDLLSYYKDALPAGITVSGEGEEAIVNYTHLVLMKAKAMMAIWSKLLGKDDAMDGLDFEEKDDPNVYKDYRINFKVDGEDSNVSINFRAKTRNTLMTDNMHYELEEEKTPQAVSNFVRIVITTITGLCPDIDVNGLEVKIAEAAYGLIPATVFKANGIVCEICGGTKTNLKVTLKPIEN